jgi:hypothetical protein
VASSFLGFKQSSSAGGLFQGEQKSDAKYSSMVKIENHTGSGGRGESELFYIFIPN